MTHPLQQRAIDLHEKAGMPWSEAEALALSEAGIDDAAIRELQGECTSSTILTGDDIPTFVRSVLVHGSALYAHPAPSAEPVWANLEARIDEFIEDYEMVGETDGGVDASYTPNERERIIIKDAIMGLFADTDFVGVWLRWRARAAAALTKPQQPVASRLRELAAELDGELDGGARWTKTQHTCESVSGAILELAEKLERAQPAPAAEPLSDALDAKRYRWLRGRAYKDGATLAIDVAVIDHLAIGDFGEFIDSVTDAAIAAHEAKR